jgi:hypothetical protein
MNLKVVIEEDTEDGGFIVSCPALPGCHSKGETVEKPSSISGMPFRDASPFSMNGHNRLIVPGSWRSPFR